MGNTDLRNRAAYLVKLSVGLLFAMVLCGCAHDPVKKDLANYMNQDILRIAELEAKSLEKYASVTGANYKSDRALEEALRDYVIPQYGRFLSMLRKIQPSTDEARSVHQVYVAGAGELHSGFRMMLMALEKREIGLFQRANDKITQGSAEVQKWRQQLLELCKKHKVKIEMGA